MDNPVMEDARATPICSHLHDNVSHILLGRVYWQGRKAVWAGRKHFTLDIRSGGTEQPVCERACAHLCACVCVSMHKQQRTSCCARVLSVWDMCGRVCVCGWAAFLSVKVTSGPPSASGEKWTVPDAFILLLLFFCYSVSSWFTLSGCEWDRHTLSGHHNTTLTTLTTGSWHIQMPAFLACSFKQYKWMFVNHTTAVSVSQTGARVALIQSGSTITCTDTNTQQTKGECVRHRFGQHPTYLTSRQASLFCPDSQETVRFAKEIMQIWLYWRGLTCSDPTLWF